MSLLIAVVAAGIWLHEPTTFPIKVVRIEGNLHYLDKLELERTLAPLVSGGFFSIDASALHQAVNTNPWVEALVIRRVWPDTVALRVRERLPVARWNRAYLLDRNGYRFRVKQQHKFHSLPMLEGPKGQHMAAWQVWRKIDQALQPIALKVHRLSMTSRQASDVELNNGLLMRLGVSQLDERLARFVKMYPAIAAHRQKMRTVDLRYSNGLAVGT